MARIDHDYNASAQQQWLWLTGGRLRDLRESPVGLSTLNLPAWLAHREGILASILREVESRMGAGGCGGAERVRAEAMREAILTARRDAQRNKYAIPPVDAVCALLEAEIDLVKYPCDQEWHEAFGGEGQCIHLLRGDEATLALGGGVSLCGRADGPRFPMPPQPSHLPPIVIRSRWCGHHREGTHEIGFTALPIWVTCQACIAKLHPKEQAIPDETAAQKVSRRLREDESAEMLRRATKPGGG